MANPPHDHTTPTNVATGQRATLQTTAPLRRVATSSGQEPVHQIARHPQLLLDAPYQRGSVWGPTRRRNLIRSLMLGIPVGNIFWNMRPDMTMAVVDGKQRIETILAFYDDTLDVPSSWFDDHMVLTSHDTPDGDYVHYSGLSALGRGMFDRASMTTQLTQYTTIAEEAALFELVNYGGVPQGDTDPDT